MWHAMMQVLRHIACHRGCRGGSLDGMKRHGWRVTCTWTQWYFGVWWWPVKGDRALGLCFGPVQLQWLEEDHNLRSRA